MKLTKHDKEVIRLEKNGYILIDYMPAKKWTKMIAPSGNIVIVKNGKIK